MPVVWFWSRIISPHMAALASSLARRGCIVTYVAEQPMSTARQRVGWSTPALPGVTVLIMTSANAAAHFALCAPENALHITQGVRSNGLVGVVQGQLAKDKRKFWAVMETVDDAGLLGLFKRFVYRIVFWRRRKQLACVLAIGRGTDSWVRARGVLASRVFPFAYFLSDPEFGPVPLAPVASRCSMLFKVIFVGRLISLKRVELLIEALAGLPDDLVAKVRLTIVGEGPLEGPLRELAERRLGDRIEWIGRLGMGDARRAIGGADCLVLPSRYDGWGAVVSEALMAGTPAITSDTCGASEVVLASGVGGLFRNGDVGALCRLLAKHVAAGQISSDARLRLAQWGRCLGGDAGADYLLQILGYMKGEQTYPAPPWKQNR